MNKHLSSALLSAVALLLPAGAVAQELWETQTETFETDTPWVHDPVVACEDGTYYLYCTGRGIMQMTSRDRQHWTVRRDGVMPDGTIPAWTHDSVPGFKDHVWAPDVIKYRGKWYMAYSCSTFGKNTSAIGLLSNTSLSNFGGWKDEGCLVASKKDRNNWNAIDPNFVIDEKGRPWMTWGSFWDGIQLVPLDKTMHVKRGVRPVTIARRHAVGKTDVMANPTSDEAGTNAIEAPFIMRHGGYYYLFVSWDYCCQGMKSTYRVAVGRSKSVAGPYVDRTGKLMTEGGGTIIAEGDKQVWEAMGHCSAYNFAGEDLFFCHGYYIPKDGMSILIEKHIVWTSDGWPELR